ncbi:MAG: hypothetical protein HKN44_09455 [Ilumatobacter sp.]|nr:hypothetical protein [Ilumatobacter sp.]
MTGHTRRAAVAVAVVLAGCAGSDASTVTTTDDPAPSSTVASPATEADPAPSTDPPPAAAPPTDTVTVAPPPSEGDTIELTGPAVVDEPAIGVVRPEGFTTATVRITEADGTTCDVCMWLADDPAERARGLMGVTDLGVPVGMAFVFQEPTDGEFYMFRTVTPLSIAWFGGDGALVSTTEMEPCLDAQSANCPRYGPAGSYQLAIEVFAGGLTDLGIGPGAQAVLVTGTEAGACLLADG